MQHLKIKKKNRNTDVNANAKLYCTGTESKDTAQVDKVPVTGHAGEIVGSAHCPSAKLVHLPRPFAAIGIS